MCNCKKACKCCVDDSPELDVSKPIEYCPVGRDKWIPCDFIGYWTPKTTMTRRKIVVGPSIGVLALRPDIGVLALRPDQVRNVPPKPVVKKLYANVYKYATSASVGFGSCRYDSPQEAFAIVGGTAELHAGYVETTLVDGKITEIKFIPRSEWGSSGHS